MTRRFGLIGRTLQHSYSEMLFNSKFEREHIDASYRPYELDRVEEVLDLVDREHLQGFNVTIPYKQTIIPLLDDVSPEAATIGAVNVVHVLGSGSNRKLVGYNTDAVGFSQSLDGWLPASCISALVLGTGGASRAVGYALRGRGIEVRYISRSPRPGVLSYESITASLIAHVQLIVNATPLGTFPEVDGCPAVPFEHLSEKMSLYDLVYNPSLTRFLRKGMERGCRIKNGEQMLRLQAEAAWEIWNLPK
ncbi:MAG: shikimate dehydrogenase [Alloprevotella sp.]|nr:shikimate dehydrogenase [Alloprevotella sp.]